MAPPSRFLTRVSCQRHPALLYSSSARHLVAASHRRSIATTSPLRNSWMDKIKGVFTGNKESPSPSQPQASAESFTLLRFADELKNARKLGKFKQYIVGRSSEATFADAFEKQEAIIRVLGGFDASGDNLQTSQKKEAAKLCNCTIADVENALAKFTWAKQAHKKVEKLKEEGKPMPKSLAEVQKLMGSTPLDLARSNLAKSGQISRNAMCPCGSGKRYKRYSTTMKVLRQGLRSFYKAESDVLRNMNYIHPRLKRNCWKISHWQVLAVGCLVFLHLPEAISFFKEGIE